MQVPANMPEILPAGHVEDHSICYEAQGFLNHSYDWLDSLLRDLAHAGTAPVAHPAAGAVSEVTLIGQPDALMPASHLFL